MLYFRINYSILLCYCLFIYLISIYKYYQFSLWVCMQVNSGYRMSMHGKLLKGFLTFTPVSYTHLGTYSTNDKTEERKQQWMEHVYKMDHQRQVKRAVDYKSVGRRSVGRDGCSEEMTTTISYFRRKARISQYLSEKS